MEEKIQVYTKYDTPAFSMMVPYFVNVRVEDIADDLIPDRGFCVAEYKLTYIENGLEGVRFFHYGN